MLIRTRERAKTTIDTEYEIVLENLSKKDKERLLEIEKESSFNKPENMEFIGNLLRTYGEIISSEDCKYFYDFKLKEVINIDLEDEDE